MLFNFWRPPRWPRNGERPARKPNIIVILADDMGIGDLGCFGGKEVATPHIDSIAASGTRFTDGYVSCAVCSPSRAALLTGRYQQRFGHEFNSEQGGEDGAVFGLPKTEKTLAQYLKPQGYRTAASASGTWETWRDISRRTTASTSISVFWKARTNM